MSRILLSILAVWLGSFWLLPVVPIEWEARIFASASGLGSVYMFGVLAIYFLFLYKMSIHVAASQDLAQRTRMFLIVANLSGIGAIVYFFARYLRNQGPSPASHSDQNEVPGQQKSS